MAAVLCVCLGAPGRAAAAPETVVNPAGVQQSRAARVKVIVLDVEGDTLTTDEKETVIAILTEAFARDAQLDVASGSELRRMLDIAAEREVAGCDDASNCMAEVVDAIGADYAVQTRAGRLGALHVLSLSVYDADQAVVTARDRIQFEQREMATLPTLLETSATKLAAAALADRGLHALPEVSPSERTRLVMRDVGFWTTTIAGSLALLSGAGAAIAYGRYAQLHEVHLGMRTAFAADPSVQAVHEAAAAHTAVRAAADGYENARNLTVLVAAAAGIGGAIWALNAAPAGGAE